MARSRKPAGQPATELAATAADVLLASLRRQVLFRENDSGYGPEAVRGEHPAVGFRLTEWGAVDRGEHGFAALAYALPTGYDLDEFARQNAAPLTVEVHQLLP